jgi:hypothetical protein
MLWKVISVGAIAVSLTTGTAFAQVAPLPDNNAKQTKEEQERAATDKAYRDAAKTIPSKSSADPWGTVRPSPPVTAKNKQ